MDLVQKSINAIQKVAASFGKRVTSNFGWAGQQAQQNIPKAVGSYINNIPQVQFGQTLAKNIQALPTLMPQFKENAYANPIPMKAFEGLVEGTTVGLKDINYRPSQNLPEKLAYGTGYTLGMLNPVSPLNLVARGIKSIGVLSGTQKILGSTAGKLIAQGGAKKLLGTGVANLSQGLPYTSAYSAIRAAGGQGNVADAPTDLAVDLGIGAIPFVGGLAVGMKGTNKKKIIDQLVSQGYTRSGLNELTEKKLINLAEKASNVIPEQKYKILRDILSKTRTNVEDRRIYKEGMKEIDRVWNDLHNKVDVIKKEFLQLKRGTDLSRNKARELIKTVDQINQMRVDAPGYKNRGTGIGVKDEFRKYANEGVVMAKIKPQNIAKNASDKSWDVSYKDKNGNMVTKNYANMNTTSSAVEKLSKNDIGASMSPAKGVETPVKAPEVKSEEYTGYSRVPTPEEVIAKIKADTQRATDAGIQKTGGVDAVWNNDPTLKGRIDSAFDKGDMSTVEKLLPQVPDEYKSNYVRVGKAPIASKPVDLDMQVQKIADDVRKERQLYGQEQMVRDEMDIRTKEGKAQIKSIKSETDAIRERLRYNEEQFAHTGSRPVSRLEMDKLFDESVAKYKTKPASVSRLDELMQTPDDRITGKLYSDDYLAQRKGQLNEAKLVKSQEVAKAKEAAAKVEADKVISEEADTFLSDLEAYKNAPPPPKQTFKQVFADFVNTLRSSYTDEAVIRQKLQAFNDVRSDKFIEIQQGDKNNVYGPVREALDAMNKAEKEAGIHYGYQENYLPQMWDNTQDEVKKVFKDRLIKTPGFSLEKVISDYKYGLENGLKPKYDSLVDLVAARQKLSTRAIASKKFYTFLTENNLIKPQEKAPGDWVMLDPESVKGTRYIDESTGIEQFKNLYAPPTVAKFVNNYFKPQEDIIAKSAKFTSSVKNIQSSFGIPGTGINAQGFHEGLRNILSAENPLEATARTFQYLLYPKAAKNYVAENLTRAPYAVRMGVNLSTNEFNSKIDTSSEAVTKLPTKLGEAWNKWFGTPLFENVIPAFKIQRFYEVQNRMIKSGMDEYSAGKAAAEFVNTAFAGINIDEIGRNKQAQNIARTFLFAPDWMESNVRMGAGIVKSLFDIKNPAGMAYRTTARNMMGAFVLANVINKATSGHYMWENDPGHTFEIESGYTEDGQKRHLKWAGTALDFARLPIDVIIGLSQGDFSVPARIVRNRLSTPAQGAFSLLTNTDAFGNPVYGKEKYGQPMDVDKQIVNVSSQVLNAVGMPWFLQEFAKGVSGQQGLEQTLLKGFELPFRYSGGAYSNTQKSVMQAVGGNLSGKEKYDITKDLKGVGLKESELAYVKDGGAANLYKLLDNKEKNAKIKEDFEKGDSSTTLDSDGVFRYMNESGNLSKIDYSKFLKTPTTNVEAMKQKYDAFKLANQILENESLSEDQKANLISKLPISSKDVLYYNNASMPTEIKEMMIQDEIQNLINQGKADLIPQYLASQRQSVAGKMMLTDTILNKLASDGQISYSTRDAVKNTTVDAKGNFTQKVKVSKPKAYKMKKITIPKIKAVKATKATKLKSVKVPKFKAMKVPKIGRVKAK